MVVTRLRGDCLPFFSSFPTAPELQKTQTMPCNFSPFSVSKSNPNLQPNEKSSTLSDAFAYRAHDKRSTSPRTGYAGTAAALCLPERHPQRTVDDFAHRPCQHPSAHRTPHGTRQHQPRQRPAHRPRWRLHQRLHHCRSKLAAAPQTPCRSRRKSHHPRC